MRRRGGVVGRLRRQLGDDGPEPQLRGLADAAPPAAIQLPPGTVEALQRQQGVVGSVAGPLFDTYLVPFEITSVLLLAAVVGAVVLAKRKL